MGPIVDEKTRRILLSLTDSIANDAARLAENAVRVAEQARALREATEQERDEE